MKLKDPTTISPLDKEYLILFDDTLESVLEAYCAKKPGELGLSVIIFPEEENSDYLSFLKSFEGLTHLRILRDLTNASSLMECKTLEYLQIESLQATLDLSQFPKLREYRGDWSNKLKSVTKIESLEFLLLSGYKPRSKDLTELSELKNLKSLELVQGNMTSLNGIECLSQLIFLGCYYQRNLSDISALAIGNQQLKQVDFESCKKIQDVGQVVSKLPAIEHLSLDKCGELDNINFLKTIPSLRRVVIMGMNILNGDLNPIIESENIICASLDNKKHYLPKPAVIDELLDERLKEQAKG